MDADVAVVGGGIVGMSVACGLLRHGLKVTVFDGDDRDLRASRGNFGLVWVQGKGDGMPEYARWTMHSAKLWPEFSKTMRSETGVDIQLSQPGGMHLCLTEQELEDREDSLRELQLSLSEPYPYEKLDHKGLKKQIPSIGARVAGATFCPMDGHVNPLHLLRALHEFFNIHGGHLINGVSITDISFEKGVFTLNSGTAQTHWQADKLVLAAGLGNQQLAGQIGLKINLKPNRGQVLILERLAPFLNFPTSHVRQTVEGTIQLGDSKEDVGFDDGATVDVIAEIARRSVQMFPLLSDCRLVRAWGALRIMTGDGFPIYQQSDTCPGSFLISCHSGVTLAAAHAGPLADFIGRGNFPQRFDVFSGDRFHVQAH